MSPYELMVKTNHHLIKGGALTDAQKRNVVSQLLAARTTPEQANRFYKGVKFSGNIDSKGRRMYPEFFIPPYNSGKKYKTIFGQMPKTHILSANMYELEILRLLILFEPGNPDICNMVTETLSRLKTTCFGNEHGGVGECYDASLIVLRFFAAAAPGETKWIEERIENYHKHFDEKHRVWQIKCYFWLCLSELPFENAKLEMLKAKAEILSQLSRSYVMNSEFDKEIHPVILCAIRNALARLPDYEYIKNREPYVSEKDGRLHFDI